LGKVAHREGRIFSGLKGKRAKTSSTGVKKQKGKKDKQKKGVGGKEKTRWKRLKPDWNRSRGE